MGKSIQFEELERRQAWPYHRIRVHLIETPYNGSKTERVFTVGKDELIRALKEAGLYETVEVPAKTPAGFDDEKQMAQTAAELSLYQSLAITEAGNGTALSTYGKKGKERLWNRLGEKLALSR